MKCKVCGANNDDYLEFCEKCAAPLTDDAASSAGPARTAYTAGQGDSPSVWGFVRAPEWPRPEFDANTVSEQDIPEDYFLHYEAPSAAAEEAPPPAPAAPEFSAPDVSAGVSKRSAAKAAAPVSVAADDDGYSAGPIKYADPIDDDYFDYGSEKTGKKEKIKTKAVRSSGGKKRAIHDRKRDRKRNIIFFAAAGVLVVAIAVLLIVFLSGGGLGSLFNSEPKPATINESMTDKGLPAYTITVFAKRGNTVRVSANGNVLAEKELTSNSVEVRVPEAVWIPTEPVEGSTVEITPDIVIIDKKGNETPVTFEKLITISVPSLALSVTSPADAAFTSASETVEFAGTVDDPSAEIFVNDLPLTPDASGNFTGAYTLKGEGVETVNVEARKAGYQIARQTFTIDYTAGAQGGGTPQGGGTIDTATVPADAVSIGYVTTDQLKVRASGSASSDILGQLPLGQKVFIIVENDGNDWSKISYNGAEAFVSKLYIKIVSNVGEYSTTPATVNTSDLRFRIDKSQDGEVITQLANNTTVGIIKDAGSGWSMIEHDGRIGFVASNYITPG